jgi:hypothetical protein
MDSLKPEPKRYASTNGPSSPGVIANNPSLS